MHFMRKLYNCTACAKSRFNKLPKIQKCELCGKNQSTGDANENTSQKNSNDFYVPCFYPTQLGNHDMT